MPQLQRLSLKAQVYEIIRQKILQQEYALGEKINIDTVADELKISNSPIREALMMLSQDGLIEMIPNNGARVISFSEEGFVSDREPSSRLPRKWSIIWHCSRNTMTKAMFPKP